MQVGSLGERILKKSFSNQNINYFNIINVNIDSYVSTHHTILIMCLPACIEICMRSADIRESCLSCFFPLGKVYNGTLVFPEHKIKAS